MSAQNVNAAQGFKDSVTGVLNGKFKLLYIGTILGQLNSACSLI